jgi:hypothetical protein
MKKRILLLTGLIFLVFTGNVSLAQDSKKKLAQTGFQFLSVISDAKAAGMAGAVNSLELGSGSLFFNPAGMAAMKHRIESTASLNQWIASMKHITFSMALNLTPRTQSLGVFGLTVQSVDYGEILSTMVADNDQGYVDLGTFRPSAFSVGIGYAKMLSDRFSVGGQVKFVKQDIGESTIPISGDSVIAKKSYNLSPMAFDFGTLFKTGFRSLTFGMSVRHFSKEVKYVEEGFQLPLIFTIGISMDLMDFVEKMKPDHSLILSIDATHDRSYPEQLLIGLDYRLMQILSLRAGYISGDDEEKFSYGFGVSKFGLDLDYGYTPFGLLGNIQRMTARFTF